MTAPIVLFALPRGLSSTQRNPLPKLQCNFFPSSAIFTILQRIESAIGAKAFHRQDFSSTAFQRKNQARKYGLAIQKNGARAAFPQLTAMLRACVAEVFAQNFQQRLVWGEGDVDFLTIQCESDLARPLRFNRECSHWS